MVVAVQNATVVCDQELGDCCHHTFACEGHRGAQQQDGGVFHFSPIILHRIPAAPTSAGLTWMPAAFVFCDGPDGPVTRPTSMRRLPVTCRNGRTQCRRRGCIMPHLNLTQGERYGTESYRGGRHFQGQLRQGGGERGGRSSQDHPWPQVGSRR